MEAVRRIAKATLEEIKTDDVPSLAAGVAFKIFLALFPGLIAAVAIFSLVTRPEDLPRLLGYLEGIMPQEALSLVEDPLTDLVGREGGTTRGVAVGAILAGLWSATSASASLVKALNRAYEAREQRGFVAQRGVAVALTLALLAALAGLVLLLIVGRQVQEALLPAALQDTVADSALVLARLAAAVLVLMVLFAFTYWLGPNRDRPEWQWISPGAAVGVLGWLVAAGGFTLYVRLFGTYDETYGALGGVAVLMLWLWLSMMMLLVGAEVNSEREKDSDPAQAQAPFPPPPAPSGPRPSSADGTRDGLLTKLVTAAALLTALRGRRRG